MPADYSKMKNDELQSLLKERGLPHTGKKADMVARLQEADKNPSAVPTEAVNTVSDPQNTAAPAEPTEAEVPEPTSVPKDEVEKKKEAVSQPSAEADAAEPVENSAETTSAAENGSKAGDADKTDKLTPEEAKAKREAEEAAFSSGMAATDIDAEIAKRKKRAEKFGLSLGAAEQEAIKALERAKKFGVQAPADGPSDSPKPADQKGVGLLDSALPEGRIKGRKRGPEETPATTDAFNDRGLVKRRRGQPGFRGRGRGRGGPRRGGGGGGGMNDADRAAAEKRKARFAQASA